jgi:hypothetical protein
MLYSADNVEKIETTINEFMEVPVELIKCGKMLTDWSILFLLCFV